MNKMELRYAKLRAKMEELGLDAIYVSSPENHLYVTDFDNPDGYAFLTKDAAWVFADSRYIEAAKAEATPLCTVCLPGQLFCWCTRMPALHPVCWRNTRPMRILPDCPALSVKAVCFMTALFSMKKQTVFTTMEVSRC